MISIDPDICKHDGICVQTCPEAVFQQPDAESPPVPVQQVLCISCGQCVALCPAGAIRHSDYPEGSIQPIQPKEAASYAQLMALIRNRRSYRYFRDQPVKREHIEQIIDAARYAPTAFNSQSSHYLVLQDALLLSQIEEKTVSSLESMARKLKSTHDEAVLRQDQSYAILERIIAEVQGGSDMILHRAPALLLLHADRHAGMAGINANLAIQNAALAAEALGLGAFFTGYILFAARQDAGFKDFLGLPENHEVFGGLALGYPKVKFKKWIERRPAVITWR